MGLSRSSRGPTYVNVHPDYAGGQAEYRNALTGVGAVNGVWKLGTRRIQVSCLDARNAIQMMLEMSPGCAGCRKNLGGQAEYRNALTGVGAVNGVWKLGTRRIQEERPRNKSEEFLKANSLLEVGQGLNIGATPNAVTPIAVGDIVGVLQDFSKRHKQAG
ncbi:hypothetical protein NDU88_002414 [Pleurodeles waltl]|uniref:Uncharacterized protein n=1 Tax=Pleurodeles waltl TaxID=8319 RepID=A0AAV7SBV9_PLEWA|nr:hypothetical protein NDU88_002414 [Pleurodeles waltl]